MKKVIIIGAGPAGLFAADRLLALGVRGILLLEMGSELEHRQCPGHVQGPVPCNCLKCGILEGIGGAGGFSDGKSTFSLTRGTQMEEIFAPEDERILFDIQDTLAHHSEHSIDFEPEKAIPEEIAEAGFIMESYPLNHLGSDGIQKFIQAFTFSLRERGVVIFSEAPVLEISKNHKHYDVRYEKNSYQEVVQAENVIVATGLQGTPWLEAQAEALGIKLSDGPAGFGIRFEAPAEVLKPLFDVFYDFKMTYPFKDFDTVNGLNEITYRSFCCNQNGYVVNENHRTLGIRNVNGHSYLDEPRSEFSNFAIIAKVDKPSAQALVREIARKINSSLGGSTAVQRVEDFLFKEPSDPNDVRTRTNQLASAGIDIGRYMPSYLRNGFFWFISDLAKILPKFHPASSFIYAPEIKYYGYKFPIDFNTWEVRDYPGLYVVGNASGYLDSFVSAALTGIIAADHLTNNR